MNYIIVDFEWNQPLPEQPMVTEPFAFDSEIIEIGAIRLNDRFETEEDYKAYVKPVCYPVMNGKVVRLTKIRPQELEKAQEFPDVCSEFFKWCGEDFCLCTWGSDDIPALLDNMLMHGMETPRLLLSCDLQKIYSREIMRDENRWSLEKAVDLLKLPKDRAHDALNDVRNTLKICERVDVFPYIEEYSTCYVDYGSDRMSGLFTGKACAGPEGGQRDNELMEMSCPYCEETLRFGAWVKRKKSGFYAYARCGEGDEFLAVFRVRRGRDSAYTVGRSIYEMNDVLWDDYQDALDAAEAGESTSDQKTEI